MEPFEGILLVDKPINWTSFDVVNNIRGTIARSKNVKPKLIKIGHIGTLDPLATGLVVLLVGKKYTTKAEELSKMDKIYEVKSKLGYITKSLDSEFPEEFFSSHIPGGDDVISVLNKFIGQTMQSPPIYSAIKLNGKRAYKLAREGKQFEIKRRPVTIYFIEDVIYKYPDLNFRLKVSSGTYIRSLVNDVGQKLKTGAFMTGLKRTNIGPYNVNEAISLKDLSIEKILQNLKK